MQLMLQKGTYDEQDLRKDPLQTSSWLTNGYPEKGTHEILQWLRERRPWRILTTAQSNGIPRKGPID